MENGKKELEAPNQLGELSDVDLEQVAGGKVYPFRLALPVVVFGRRRY